MNPFIVCTAPQRSECQVLAGGDWRCITISAVARQKRRNCTLVIDEMKTSAFSKAAGYCRWEGTHEQGFRIEPLVT